MSESVESFLARGGKIREIPNGKGKKEPQGKLRQGDGLRLRMSREAQTGKRQDPLLARENGGGK